MNGRKAKARIEGQLTELKLNLENNYKDLARQACRDLGSLIGKLYDAGELKEKDYKKYLKTAQDYEERMKDYHH